MRATGFVVFAVTVTVLPAFVVAWNMGAMAPFWFLAGDAYLYLGIGQASHGASMSFDGLRATNGFHPLWQIWVRLATALSAGDPLRAMTTVSYAAIACTTAGVLVLGAAIRRATGSWLLAMLAVPGVYFLVIGQALHNLPVWAFFDGMEGGLAFLLSAVVLGLVATGAPAPALGIALALLVLARLDEVFVPAAMAVAVSLWPRQDPGAGPGRTKPRRWPEAAWLMVPTGLGVGLFALWSWATTGMLVPVSGAAKGEGALLQNGWVTLATLFAPLIDLRQGLTPYVADRAGLAGGAFRVVELIVPALFALGFLAALWRRFRAAPWAPYLAGIAAGVLIKALYSLVSVNYWHQASWYFAMATALMTFGTALLLAPAAQRLNARGARLAALALGGLSLLHASLWSAGLMTDPLRAQQRDFWLARDTIDASLHATAPDARVLEFGDGMLNFTLAVPVRHGFVFAGDAESLAALRAHRLLADAVADGFTLLSSYEYLRVPEGAEAWDSARIRAFLESSFLDSRVKDELGDFDLAMAYVARPWGVPFIRLIPRR
ncbi:MAG TPA: hypothetical protein PLG62_10170 [Pararhodobacter sp.]|uniref:hypothetical protein n=1 Tax=Pararhodobacter sp. TaxID=2127056 RepID=UPI001DFD3210|nr:hypothetical protein [Pararhodobacter sp.]MCB1345880.1 hypothetical protein [Paracoccaceae bacterium]HPD92819.1 hypothetical protein [Pararhodobacter sp.]